MVVSRSVLCNILCTIFFPLFVIVCESILKLSSDQLFQQKVEESGECSWRSDSQLYTEIFRIIGSSTFYSAVLKGHIKYSDISFLAQYPVKYLDISETIELTSHSFYRILEACSSLKCLLVGSVSSFTGFDVHSISSGKLDCSNNISSENAICSKRLKFYEKITFKCQNIQRISIRIGGNQPLIFLTDLLSRCPNLMHLSLEGSHELHLDSSRCFTFVQRLSFLNLHNVRMTSCTTAFNILKCLINLRHLDLSVSSIDPIAYTDAAGALMILLTNMPYLKSLDISCTNLLYNDSNICIPSCWEAVRNREFEFIGLLDCVRDPCYSSDFLNANEIAGLASDAQIVSCLKRYKKRPLLISKALNALFLRVRRENNLNCYQVLLELLDLVVINKSNLHVLIPATATLFYLIKSCSPNINCILRRNIIRIVLTILEEQSADLTILRNGSLILHSFPDTDQFLFTCRRLVRFIIEVLRRPFVGDSFVERYFLHFLNVLACSVKLDVKDVMGNAGIVECLLNLINRSISIRAIETIECCFSILWNVTDETPDNCEKYLSSNGLDTFVKCYEAFDNKDLYRNMTGLIGNVAEVATLRDKLRTRSCLRILDPDDCLEISYNTVGILVHLMHDGFDGFPEAGIEVDECLERIFRVISEKWKVESTRLINYRSLSPILNLLPSSHCPIVQLWVVWALANLTTTNPDKYLPMLKQNGGMSSLTLLCNECNPVEIETVVQQHKGIFPSWRSAIFLSKQLAKSILQNFK